VVARLELSIITVAYIITMGIMKRNFKTRKNLSTLHTAARGWAGRSKK